MVTGSWADELGASKHKQRAPKKRKGLFLRKHSAQLMQIFLLKRGSFVLDGGFKETMREEIKKHLKPFRKSIECSGRCFFGSVWSLDLF